MRSLPKTALTSNAKTFLDFTLPCCLAPQGLFLSLLLHCYAQVKSRPSRLSTPSEGLTFHSWSFLFHQSFLQILPHDQYSGHKTRQSDRADAVPEKRVVHITGLGRIWHGRCRAAPGSTPRPSLEEFTTVIVRARLFRKIRQPDASRGKTCLSHQIPVYV